MTTVSTISSGNSSSNQTVPEGCIVLQFAEFVPWDNPDNVLDYDTVFAFEQVLHGVCLPVLCLVSVVTNPLNMAVAYKHGLKERINLCIFALALLDMSYFIFMYSLYADKLYRMIKGATGRYGEASKFFVGNGLIGVIGIKWAVDFVTTVTACERCLCVVSPLRYKTALKTKTLAAIILVVCLIVTAGFFPVGLRWGIACIYDIATNTTSTTVYPSRFYINNRRLIDLLDGLVYGFVLPVISVTTVSAATTITLIKLSKMAAWRGQSASTTTASVSPRMMSLTRMLVGTSILFVVCSVPLLVRRFLQLLDADVSLGGRYRNLHDLLTYVELLFSYINSSGNFFVYVALGSRFRETLREMFKCDFWSDKQKQPIPR
ncbi:hypothetical protein BaRGS_00007241 [Batillaria attramentaria]|uniref:G-protein coupled receptors family 1 profile domain-containing protein n=1 Tax=Batillaria attramentaria TaxID=370345 RepID=A0ABD0LPQ7_9CAEN